MPEFYSNDLWLFVQSMLRLDQEKRVSVDDLVRHPLIEPHLEPSVKAQVDSQGVSSSA